MARTAVIVIGGAGLEPAVLARLPADLLVIAADSGFDVATEIGLRVDLLVGDLDSISPAGLAAAEASGVAIDRHPADKDATDTELAIRAAVERGVEHVVGLSGSTHDHELRLDHDLGALFAFADPLLAGREVEAWWGRAHVRFVHGPGLVEVVAPPDAIVSLLPIHGSAGGVTTAGLRYPLLGETLGAGTSRGISNEMVAPRATVAVEHGVLLVIQPFALGGAP